MLVPVFIDVGSCFLQVEASISAVCGKINRRRIRFLL